MQVLRHSTYVRTGASYRMHSLVCIATTMYLPIVAPTAMRQEISTHHAGGDR